MAYLIMRRRWIYVLFLVLMFNSSCVSQSSGMSCAPSDISDINKEHVRVDATVIPRTAFAKIETYFLIRPPKGDDFSARSSGTGSFIYRSQADAKVGFVLTAAHICNSLPPDMVKGNKVIAKLVRVTDFYGREHEAKKYISSDVDDVCVMSVKDVQSDIQLAPLADRLPAPGSDVFAMVAPRGYFKPGAPIVFRGLMSGVTNAGMVLFSIITEPGTSGSPVFDTRGEIVGIIVAMPYVSNGPDKEYVMGVGVAESIGSIRRVTNSLVTADEIFGLSITSTKSER